MAHQAQFRMEQVNTFMTTQPNEFEVSYKKQPDSKVPSTPKCRDFVCGIIFISYMLANLALSGVSIFNGNFQNISKIVDYNNETCGNGTNSEYPCIIFDYLDIFYPSPCSGKLNIKICVKECPSNVTIISNNLNTSSTTQCATKTYDPSLTCSTSCSVYDSYPYLQKICVPANPDNSLIPLLQNLDTEIILSNIAVSFKQIIYLSAIVIGVAFVAYFVQILFPPIIYLYIGVIFVCILLLAFLILKLTQIRKQSLPSPLNNSPLIISDEERQQTISYILFGIYFICLPLLMLIKQRLKKVVNIMKSFVYFLFTSLGIHLFNLICVIVLCIEFSFEIFVLVNYFTNGKVTPNPSPFRTYNHNIVHTISLVFLIIGFIWLISFTLSFHKFIVSCYTYFWFREQEENGPTFQPLQRSITKSYYNFGSICIDALVWPINLLMTLIYSVTKNTTNVNYEESNQCIECLNDLKFKVGKAIEIAYRFLNRGSFCSMVINNENYFKSNKQFAELHLDQYNKYFGFGTILFTYNSLFIVMVSLTISYFMLYFQIINVSLPTTMSSLIIPLVIVFLFALAVAGIMGNTIGYGLDSMIVCTVIGTMKPEPERYVFEITKIIEDV